MTCPSTYCGVIACELERGHTGLHRGGRNDELKLMDVLWAEVVREEPSEQTPSDDSDPAKV